MTYIIVSRHAATVAWLRTEYPDLAKAPVVDQACTRDVAGRIVVGNIPMHLAVQALEVWAVEFTGDPPRGREYGPEDMTAAGARVRRYRVVSVDAEGENGQNMRDDGML